jgi:hypothetical protein
MAFVGRHAGRLSFDLLMAKRRRQSKSGREVAALWPVRIGLRLLRERRMTPGCIAQRLHTGTKTYLSRRLYERGWERRKKR